MLCRILHLQSLINYQTLIQTRSQHGATGCTARGIPADRPDICQNLWHCSGLGIEKNMPLVSNRAILKLSANSLCLTGAFRSYFEFEVLATPKMNAYIKDAAGRRILKNNLAKFLFLRSKKLNGYVRQFLPIFIRDMMHGARSYVNSDEAEAALRKVLCELLVETHASSYSCVVKDIDKYENGHFKYGIDADDYSNRVAAAAAAGSLEGLGNLAFKHRELLWNKSDAFGYPLNAAVHAGHFHVVKTLSQQAADDNSDPNAILPEYSRQCFSKAILTGIDLQRLEFTQYLLKIYFDIFGFATEDCTHAWLRAAVRTGNENMTRTILASSTQAGTRCFYNAFKISCSLGRPNIARLFFEADRLRVDEMVSHDYPLLTAISSDAISTVQVLLELGANPDGTKYLQNVYRPLSEGLLRKKSELCCLLLRHGANPYLIRSCCFICSQPFINSDFGLAQLFQKALKEMKRPCGDKDNICAKGHCRFRGYHMS